MAASKDVGINTIPLDAPLSIPEPPMTWIVAQNCKGVDSKRLALPNVDLSGKWVLVSGSNNGIGRHAAVQFAAWGANMILAARDPPEREKHPSKVVEECKEAARMKGHEKSTI
jgi:hypothetical protein